MLSPFVTLFRWFHFGCVGVKDTDPCVVEEDAPYFCPDCTKKRDRAKAKADKAKAKAKARARAEGKAAKQAGSQNLKPRGGGGSPPKRSLLAPKRSAEAASASAPSLLGPSSKWKRQQSDLEEERWLDAVEAGEDVHKLVDPELRAMRDPALMTARQRACRSEEQLSMEESGKEGGKHGRGLGKNEDSFNLAHS